MLTTMLRSVREIYGYSVRCADDYLGEIAEFSWNEQEWKIQSLIVKRNTLEFHRKMLSLPAQILEEVDMDSRTIFIQLSKEEVLSFCREVDLRGVDSHLKPVRALLGFGVAAKNGPLGLIEDLLLSDADLSARYVVIRVPSLGKKYLLSPWWIDRTDWKTRNIHLKLTLAEAQEIPEYNFHTPINRHYEDKLHAEYGKRSYWG